MWWIWIVAYRGRAVPRKSVFGDDVTRAASREWYFVGCLALGAVLWALKPF